MSNFLVFSKNKEKAAFNTWVDSGFLVMRRWLGHPEKSRSMGRAALRSFLKHLGHEVSMFQDTFFKKVSWTGFLKRDRAGKTAQYVKALAANPGELLKP